MSGLAEFLEARIAEDEASARAAQKSDRWFAARFLYETRESVHDWNDPEVDQDAWAVTADQLLREVGRDPSRVLAECEARRRIVERCLEARADADYQPSSGSAELADDTLSLLALAYSDHPDFDPSWRV